MKTNMPISFPSMQNVFQHGSWQYFRGLTEQRAVTYTIMSQNGSWQTFRG